MFRIINLLVLIIIMTQTSYSQQFPSIEAETLSQKKVVFPEVTQGKYAFILIAFRRQTQEQVDSWLDPFIREFGENEQVTFYEIPMISNNWKWMSGWIDSGMRAGVPNYKHDHVATYYGKLSPYFDFFDIKDKSLCYVFLINKSGGIVWREEGALDSEKYNELRKTLNSFL